ncbi:MAG: hypothetical protein KF860_01635 [Cyclobacteriaceae bacterium]|nr:hypothetical protein [Cyclobacteriaceae bacterium]
MRKLLPILLLIVFACQGKLTEEQKKKMWDEKKAHEIVKISDAEITEAAFQYGRSISEEIKKLDSSPLNAQLKNELQQKYHVRIHVLSLGDPQLMGIEQQLMEAYEAAADFELVDNIQKIGKDSLIYTLPITNTQSDGTVNFKYVVGVRMAKKDVILSMNKD